MLAGADVEVDLVEALRAEEIEFRKAVARRARLVDRLDRDATFRIDGHCTVGALVRTVTLCSSGESHALLRTGRMLREHPAIGAAMDAGELGVQQAHLMARAAAHPRCGDQFEAVAEILLEAAKVLKYSEFTTLVDHWVSEADQDGANQRAAASHENRNAWIQVTGDGFHGSLHGCAVVGVALKEILDRFVKAEWDKDWQATKDRYGSDAVPAQMPRTDTQRRADAICAIFEAAISTPADAKAPEPVVNLLADPVTFCKVLAVMFGLEVSAAQEAAADELVAFEQRYCRTSTGIPVSHNELAAALLAGWIRRVVVDSAGVVIDMGRKQRLFKGDVRIAALMNWLRCFWPGCEVPAARCHTDHLIEWRHGGTTSPDDGAPACGHHNLFKYNNGYTVRRDAAGRLRVYRPDGTEVR